MKQFEGKLPTIAVAVTLALLGIPAYAAKPVLVKDLAPGSFGFKIVGASQDHLYMSSDDDAYFADALFAVDSSGQISRKLLPKRRHGEVIAQGATILFGYNDSIHGTELWRSDGTRAGTYLVKDLVAGPESSGGPGAFAYWRGKVYFTTLPQKHERDLSPSTPPQLWSTDGTTEGTQLVTDLDTVMWFGGEDDRRVDLGRVIRLIVGQDKLFFNVENYDSDDEFLQRTLWQSDGTASGTAKMVYPENNEPVFASDLLGSVGNISFFADNQPFDLMSNMNWTTGKLWRISDAGQEISILTDALASPASGIFEGHIYFLTRDDSGLYLARTDENATVVETVALLYPASSLAESVDVKFMAGTTSLFIGIYDIGYYRGHINDVWAFSSSSQTTEKISDGGGNSEAIVKEDMLYFGKGGELWRSDGSAAGTGLYRDLNPTGSSSPSGYRLFAGELWFRAYDGSSGQSFFRTNGADSIVKVNIDASVPRGSQPYQFTALRSGITLFREGQVGRSELYVTRGTPETTSIHPLSSPDRCLNCEFEPLLPRGEGALLFTARTTPTLWYTDSQGSNAIMSNMWSDRLLYPVTKRMLAPFGQNGALFFSVELNPDRRTYSRKLWRTDVSSGETTLVKSIPFPILSFYHPKGSEAVVPHQKLVFFMGNNSQHGNELWRTDGSESGTYMVKDLVPGNAEVTIENITSARHHVYFTYADGGRIHLAKSRGSANDTMRVVTLPADINAIQDVTSVNNSLFFRSGRDLYRSTGQMGNLRRLGQFAYSSYASYIDTVTTDWPAAMTAFGNHLYFIARKGVDDPLHVWRADCRKNQSEIVTPNFKVHALGAQDVGFHVHRDRLFLTVMDRLDRNGGIFELRTSGKNVEWVRHTSMSAKELRVAGNKMYFAGLDDQYGEEPRVMPLPRKP